MQNFSEKCEVSCSEKLGRHLIAGMDIAPGEVILEEKPLLIAPHWECGQMKCSKCLSDSYVICKKCKVFPLCIGCSTHDDFDCNFFASDSNKSFSKDFLVKNYAIFAALKLLLLLENPKTANDANVLLSKKINLDDLRDSEMWQEQTTNVVDPLLKSGIAEMFTKFKVDEDFLHKLCCSIDASSFEVVGSSSSRDNCGGDSLKGVYVYGAKFPHHCVPNTVVAIDDDYTMQIYAAVPIRRGEIIYNSYANPLMGTSQRQHHLYLSKHIECECSRCLDPSELGSHMSSMKCKQCSDGYALCQPTKNSNWICTKCAAVMDSMSVHKLLAEVGEQMVYANGDLHLYEALLSKYAMHFHDNHFLIIDIKQNIATILRAILMNHMSRPSKQILERRVQLCKEILPVVRAVLPGISKLYAIALYEYLISLLELLEIQFKSEELTAEEYLKKQLNAREIADEAMKMLAYEPSNSPEGQLVQSLGLALKQIDDNMKQDKKKK